MTANKKNTTNKKNAQTNKDEVKYRQSIKARYALKQWYKTPLGRALLTAENAELETVLPHIFGYHLLQIGQNHASSYLDSSAIRHHILSDNSADDAIDEPHNINLQMNGHNFSIASDSVDAVVLPHTLDLDMNPQQVLRETDRVLVPEGRVVILGFNPWSCWGVRHIPNVWGKHSPYSLRFLSPMRIKDWLTLLGFEIESVKTFFYRLPISNPVILKKMSFLDSVGAKVWPAFGSVYLIVARKQVSTLTPVRPRLFLRHRPPIIPGFIETRAESKAVTRAEIKFKK